MPNALKSLLVLCLATGPLVAHAARTVIDGDTRVDWVKLSPVTVQDLRSNDVRTIGELALYPKADIQREFLGGAANELFALFDNYGLRFDISPFTELHPNGRKYLLRRGIASFGGFFANERALLEDFTHAREHVETWRARWTGPSRYAPERLVGRALADATVAVEQVLAALQTHGASALRESAHNRDALARLIQTLDLLESRERDF